MGLQLHTRTLTAGQSMVLDGTEGVLQISYQMSSTSGDNGTLLGNIPFRASNDIAPQNSTAVTIPAGGGNVFDSNSNQKALVLTIACVQGSLEVIIGF